MKQQKSYLVPFILVTSLFFFWGLVHNMDPILIPHLRKAFRLNTLESSLVDSAVFIGYFVMAIPAEVVNWQGRSKGLFREAMRGTLPECIRERNWKADFTFLPNETVANDYPRFQRYLQPGCLGVKFGYLDPIGLRSEFLSHKDRLEAKTVVPANRVSGTAALELWLRMFFKRKS